MKPVLVTTEFRGVFYGEVIDDSKTPDKITLANARNCIYWSADCGGFLGLASGGPTDDCNIGKQVSRLTLYKITSVTPVSEVAAEKWRKA